LPCSVLTSWLLPCGSVRFLDSGWLSLREREIPLRFPDEILKAAAMEVLLGQGLLLDLLNVAAYPRECIGDAALEALDWCLDHVDSHKVLCARQGECLLPGGGVREPVASGLPLGLCDFGSFLGRKHLKRRLPCAIRRSTGPRKSMACISSESLITSPGGSDHGLGCVTFCMRIGRGMQSW